MAGRESGERVVTVRVNGADALVGLDLARQVGRYTTLERTARATASGGGILVEFEASTGAPVVSGIALRPSPELVDCGDFPAGRILR